MGVDTIQQLLGIVEDEKGISTFDKIRTYLMINMQTITDKTPSHISEMLIIGNNKEIIDAIKTVSLKVYLSPGTP